MKPLLPGGTVSAASYGSTQLDWCWAETLQGWFKRIMNALALRVGIYMYLHDSLCLKGCFLDCEKTPFDMYKWIYLQNYVWSWTWWDFKPRDSSSSSVLKMPDSDSICYCSCPTGPTSAGHNSTVSTEKTNATSPSLNRQRDVTSPFFRWVAVWSLKKISCPSWCLPRSSRGLPPLVPGDFRKTHPAWFLKD